VILLVDGSLICAPRMPMSFDLAFSKPNITLFLSVSPTFYIKGSFSKATGLIVPLRFSSERNVTALPMHSYKKESSNRPEVGSIDLLKLANFG
jgi:hypothetical protein